MEIIISTLRSPGPDLISIGPLTLRWYGILIALSVFIGLNLSNRLAYQRNLRKDLINDLMPILLFSSIFGARIYYVVFEWNNFKGINFWSSINFLGLKIPIPTFLEIWKGGIAIHGALIVGIISVIFFCRSRKENCWDVIDVLLPSVALGQAIGRWGNFFNNEAFGLPTSQPWKLFIPYASRPEPFLNNSFFHPTFLYESIWNMCIFLFLIFLFRLNNRGLLKLPPGALSCVYFISYGIGRAWIESLRTDPLCLGALPPFCEGGIRIAQLISFLMIFIGSFGLYWIYQRKHRMPSFGIISKRTK